MPRVKGRPEYRDKDGNRLICRRCSFRAVNRPRGLCFHCYHAPGARDEYERIGKGGARGIGSENPRHKLPEPDPGLIPGTDRKIAIMHERAKAGLSLFHPDEIHFAQETAADVTL